MKILLLALDVDLGASSGDVVHVYSIAKAFSDLGHKVLVLVGATSPEVIIPGVTVRVQRKKYSGLLRILDDLRAVAESVFWLGISGDRLIYERRFSCKVGLIVKWLTWSRLGIEINGLIDDESSVQGQRFRKAHSWSLRFADKIIAVAPGLAAALHNRYRIPEAIIKVVSNGVDGDLFYPQPVLGAKTRVCFDTSHKHILFAGNFVDWYDFPLLLDAFKIVLLACPAARLILVGEGRLKDRIERIIESLDMKNAVVLTGRIQHRNVPEYVSASDVCVAPFTRERNENIDLSPIKLFEYLASGRPVVASDIGGLERYAVEMPALHLVETGNVQAFAAKILELFENPQHEKSDFTAKLVRRNFSWRQTAIKILEWMK